MGAINSDVQNLLRGKADPDRWVTRLLGFARTDLDQLTPEEWRQLQERIQQFCAASAPFDLSKLWQEYPFRATARATRRFQRGVPKELRSRGALRAVQQELQNGLRQLFPETFGQGEPIYLGEWKVPASFRSISLTSRVVIRKKKRVPNNRFLKEEVLVHTGRAYRADWPDLFWIAVLEVLEECGPRIRRCEECRTLFLKRKRMAYCSSECSQRVRSRRWRAAHPSQIPDKRP